MGPQGTSKGTTQEVTLPPPRLPKDFTRGRYTLRPNPCLVREVTTTLGDPDTLSFFT